MSSRGRARGYIGGGRGRQEGRQDRLEGTQRQEGRQEARQEGTHGQGPPAGISRSTRGGNRFSTSDAKEIMRVSKESEMPRTAGAIAWRAREGQPIILEAAGPTCLNIAAKSIIIARNMLVSDGIDLKCTPKFHSPSEEAHDPETLNTVLRIYINTEKSRPPKNQEGSLIRAGTNSDPKKVAGAIARNVRNQEVTAISAGGRLSINNALKAVAIARSYLEEDMLDIAFQPEFPNPADSEVHFVIHSRRARNAPPE